MTGSECASTWESALGDKISLQAESIIILALKNLERISTNVLSYLRFCPTGVVFPFVGTTAPDGWLLCNGAAVSRLTYSALWQVIGTSHGAGNGSTTFNLPDYRGRFLRGTDTMGSAASRDPDKLGRTASASGGNTGDNIGSIQGDATAKKGLSAAASSVSGGTGIQSANHTHSQKNVGNQTGSLDNMAGYGLTITPGYQNRVLIGTNPMGYYTASTGGQSADHSHTLTNSSAAAQTLSGDNETRPVNINVNYIIKI